MTLSLEFCYSKGLGVVDGLWMRQKPLKVLRHPSSFFVLGASISALLTLNFFISFTFFQTNFPNFFFFFESFSLIFWTSLITQIERL